MHGPFTQHLRSQLAQLDAEGLTKRERILTSPQGAWVEADGRRVVNLCANNYLGPAGRRELVEAGCAALRRYGFGLSSVRFICGTQDVHKALEARLAGFLGFEDAILFSSCFDANGGVFEALLGEEDAVVSDALNHASLIDGIRLCKAKRFRYANGDMADLARQLAAADAAGARFKLVATDGVFSMDGSLADLPAICDLAERHGAMVLVDDSHAVGFVGEKGRGTPEHHGVAGRVDLVTGTLGKALGGAAGGYVAGVEGGGGLAPAEGPALPLLQHRCRRSSPGRAWRCSTCSSRATRCARGSARTRASSGPSSRGAASRSSRASTPSSR